MEQYIVLCSITRREITAALQSDETCGTIKNTEKRYIITVSEDKNEYISGNLQF